MHVFIVAYIFWKRVKLEIVLNLEFMNRFEHFLILESATV